MEQDELAAYENLCRELSGEEVLYFSEIWEKMVRENTKLRTVICGNLCSVGEEFYDEMICRYLSEKPVYERAVIGNFLEETAFGIDSLLPAWRIEKLIERGVVKVIGEAEESGDSLSRKICKCV